MTTVQESRAALHAALIEHRQSSMKLTAIRRQVERGQTWPGAVNIPEAQFNHLWKVAQAAQKAHDELTKPALKASANDVRSVAGELAKKQTRVAELEISLALAEAELVASQEYVEALTAATAAAGDDANEYYLAYLDAHCDKSRGQVETLKERIVGLETELADLRKQLPTLAQRLEEKIEALHAVAV